MLGGFESLSATDVAGSFGFVRSLLNPGDSRSPPIALDVAAGIGRVTKLLLSKFCQEVDLLERNTAFLDESLKVLKGVPQVANRFCSSMEAFIFPRKYGLIWIQWAVIYLCDDDFVRFFSRCREALVSRDSLIIVKDNCTRASKTFVLDRTDCSVTRSAFHLQLLFAASGLKIVKEANASGFPPELYPVKMWALVQASIQ